MKTIKIIIQSEPAKRYTKKTRQAVVSSSLDPLGLPAAVARAFVCKKLVWSPPPIGRRGMVCVYNMKADTALLPDSGNFRKKAQIQR